MSMNLEEAKAYLQKESDGVSLYDHLSDVLLKILVEKPENTCEAFEHISEAVKQSRFKGQDTTNNETQLDIDAVRFPSCTVPSLILFIEIFSREMVRRCFGFIETPRRRRTSCGSNRRLGSPG